MNDGRQSLGKKGEQLAQRYLEERGYAILARNYRTRRGEIDIIAEDDETLVFVEVKTRQNALFGSPFEAVTARKQRQLIRAALDYLVRQEQAERSLRFDVVAVTMDGGTPHFELLKNAFALGDD